MSYQTIRKDRDLARSRFTRARVRAYVFNGLIRSSSRGQSIAVGSRYSNASSHHVLLSAVRLPIVPAVHFAYP
jgi:hypothetical protein